jgi:hypothetical protein
MPERRNEWLFQSHNLNGGTHGQYRREHRDVHVGRSPLKVRSSEPAFQNALPVRMPGTSAERDTYPSLSPFSDTKKAGHSAGFLNDSG